MKQSSWTRVEPKTSLLQGARSCQWADRFRWQFNGKAKHDLIIDDVRWDRTAHRSFQVIPSHGNHRRRWTSFGGYLFKYCSVKYQTFHQVSKKTSQQTYQHQKTTWKAFQMPPRAITHQLTCPIELTSGSFLIGRLVFVLFSQKSLYIYIR